MIGAYCPEVPFIGGSGGISGIIAFYALKFPRARISFVVRLPFPMLIRMSNYMIWFRMPVYAMFLIWVAMQFLGLWKQLSGFSHVSSLVHLGGGQYGDIFLVPNQETY